MALSALKQARASAWLALAIAGCVATAPRKTADAHAVPPEASVRPGVNDRYYTDDALETYTEIFEGPGREVARERDAILDALRIEPGTRIGDLGAGTGLYTFELAARTGPRGRVFAVELVPAFVERLREQAAAQKTANVEIVVGRERETALADGSIDLAILINVYHHLEYPRSYMASVLRALAPDGRVVVVDFHRIEGVTAPSLLKHVRAGRDVVRAEIEQAGFELSRQETFLRENYFLEFRRRGAVNARVPGTR